MSKLFRLLVAALALTGVGALPGCETEDPGPPAGWQVVFEELPGALFSVWGTSASDVWIVGGHDYDEPAGPQVLHWDGKAWQKLDSGLPATVNLWWVWGLDDDVWMAGSGGHIARYRRSTGQFEAFQAPTDTQLFGILPVSKTEVWAVGGPGLCKENQPCGVVWRFDGTAWAEAPGLAADVRNKASWNKICKDAKGHLLVVGSQGRMLRWDGQVWTEPASGTDRMLLTCHTGGNRTVAVGGFGTGALVEDAGQGFADATPADMPQMNGVYVDAKGRAVAGGVYGSLWESKCPTCAWQPAAGAPEALLDHHAVYRDPQGGIWAVGGQILSEPFAGGQLLHYGPKIAEDLPK